MHLATYSKEPNSDCSSFLVQVVLTAQATHIALIIASFSGGMEMVKCTVLTTIPRQVTWVLGGTSFLELTVRPSSDNNCCNLTYVWLILEGKETHRKSPI